MPAINGPADQYFLNQLAMFRRQIRELATQQNWGITDGNQKLRIRGGLQTTDGNAYGIYFFNPTTGVVVAKMTGTKVEFLSSAGHVVLDLTDAGLALYGATGKLLIDLTDTGLAVYDATGHELVLLDDTGQTVYNASGTEEVKLGAQPGGGFGLSVRNAAGSMARVSAPVSQDVNTELTTSSTSYATIGGPSVTVTVGEAGQALVIASSEVGINGGATASYKQGLVGVQVDGGTTKPLIGVSQSPDSTGYITGIQVTATNAYLWSGLSQGSHTFKCLYRSTNGQAIYFSLNSLVVIPY